MEQPLSLCQFLDGVKSVVDSLPHNVWVLAEISELRVNNGHCYLTLIEKSDDGKLAARANAVIWRNVYAYIRPYFEETTRQSLAPGIKVLLSVSASFQPQFGFSLIVDNIDPTYTLGEMALKREETIKRLKTDGVWDMNRDLPFPILPQRIAIISSSTAAGFGDFMDQLLNNTYGFKFYVHLFQACMQGDNAPASIISAFERVFQHIDLFDAIVIIRGGGATSDMLAFDDYELAFNCTQMPLPVITGIGHDRDECVLDMVANVRCKTPTAVAAFLIDCFKKQLDQLDMIASALCSCSGEVVNANMLKIANLSSSISKSAKLLLGSHESLLAKLSLLLQRVPLQVIDKQESRLDVLSSRLKAISTSKDLYDIQLMQLRLKSAIQHLIVRQKSQIELVEQKLNLMSPDNLLKKGYTYTTKNGKIVKSANELIKGDVVETVFHDGRRTSVVE